MYVYLTRYFVGEHIIVEYVLELNVKTLHCNVKILSKKEGKTGDDHNYYGKEVSMKQEIST